MRTPVNVSRHTVRRISAVATIAGIAVLTGALIAVSYIRDDVAPATILRAAVGFLVLVATIGCSAAVWAICCAFESVAELMSAVTAIRTLAAPQKAVLHLVEHHGTPKSS
jgi:hypothetical protein